MSAGMRWAQRTFIVILSVVIAMAAEAQDAGPARVALVFGNSEYEAVGRLPNPVNDAEAVAEAFERLGFDVTVVTDADYASMRRSLQDFEILVGTAEVAVVYFAGHGMEIEGTNYLIPTDAQLKRDTHVFDETIPLDRVLTAVQQASALRLVILDACRDNPFAGLMEMTGATRAIGRGLARYDPSGSTILAYAAREGTTADDGGGDHSPFTAALLGHLETPGLEISFVFRRVRDDVMAATGGLQEPVVYSSLGRDEIYFAASAVGGDVTPIPQGQATPAGDQQGIVVAYQAALAIDTLEAWESFLRYYPTGLYADLARAALNKSSGGALAEADVDVIADRPTFVGEPDAADTAAAVCDRLAAYEYDSDRPGSVASVRDVDAEANADEALEACRRAVNANPDDRRMLVQLSRAANYAAEPEEAYQAALQASELGSAVAMATVGINFQLGLVVEQNYAQAADWFRRAADAGSSDGMLNLGYLYDQGLGVPFDLDESGRWFARAAEAGNASAIAALGFRMENGRGVEQDLVEARYWYQRAAERGDGFAMRALAQLHEDGRGGPVDYVAALAWYQQAADAGVIAAMASIGLLNELGLGTDIDLELARSWYERGAADDDPQSMFALGRVYDAGVGVEQDYEEAARWYSQSALTGEMPFALVRLGMFFDQGLGVEQDFTTARSLWEEAAAAGEADALVNLGYLFEFGRGVPQDFERAGRYYVEALEAGSQFGVDEFLNHWDEYPTGVRRMVEAYLIAEGLMTGKPDGLFDGATADALRRLGPG